MIPVALVGIWAAAQVNAYPAAWYPSSPIDRPAHFFLVVRKGDDGVVRAFIRNPEANAGAFWGVHDTLPSPKPDGSLVIDKVTMDGRALSFHRATNEELMWYYPRKTENWTYNVPAQLNDGWRVGTLASSGMNEAPLAGLMQSIISQRDPTLRSPYIHSIAIARHGKLVLDEYFYGFDPQSTHDLRSAGKSVTTLMVGRAIADTHAFSPQSRVLDVLGAYRPVKNDDARKERMTVADLMTMAPGFACDDNDDNSPGNEDTMQSQPAGTDWYRYTLNLPMINDPGNVAYYCSASINLLGAVVATETKKPLTRYFNERFAVPMQFGTYAMWLMPPPASQAYMAGGDYMRPRDFLKFGQLLLDGGEWNGTQVVDSGWIRESIVPRTAPVNEGDRYGYGWHLLMLSVGGTAYDVVSAGGNGGQLLIVVPKLDLAIMVTAGNYGQFPVWRNFLPQITSAAILSCG
ncbi:MAG: serine hydrolase [Candidatus Eremiobacteraeota bacterium]|nr:serine hydrolase [Candidatus Eremiobacteraeota bacterium]